MSEHSSKPSSSKDSDSDGKGELMQSFIRGLAKAVTNDMKETLCMVPGGEFTEDSIESVKQSAQAVIQQQCELLYNPRKQIHKEICMEIVRAVNKLTAKFEQHLNWDQFSEELAELMEKSVDALNENKSSLSSKSSDSSGTKSSTQKQKKTQAEQQHRPAGPDERAFGAG